MSGGSSRSNTSSTSIVKTDNSNTQQNGNEIALSIKDVSNSTINTTDHGAVKESFKFSSDPLDKAFNFGTESLNSSREFGENILSEASEISRDALQIAGNAQTNAFRKIKDIAASFTNTASGNTTTVLMAIGGSVAVIALLLFMMKGKR